MTRLLDAVQGLGAAGILTEGDEEIIVGEIGLLYAKLYEPYKGFREVTAMVDERIMTRFDKIRIEFDKMKIAIKAEARAEGIAEGRVEGIAEGRVEGIAEGRVEGIAEGRVEGIAEGMVKVARNLLNAGVSKEIIVQTTGLTIADIEKQATIAASASPAAGN